MIRHLRFISNLLFVLTGILLCSCGGNSTGGSEGTSTGKGKQKKFYWIQPLKGHPVHQLTQIGFREGCRKHGYDCEIVGTDGPDIAGTISLGEQCLARGDAAGIAIWTGNPAYNALIERAGRQGVPVILPHFLAPEGSIPGATGVICCDPAEYAREAAEEIGMAINGQGVVSVTQGSFNTTENLVAATFITTMKEKYHDITALAPIEEGFDAPAAISKCISILQAHPDINAAFSTTGGGPVTWANAKRETGRNLIIVGMDYTRVNLDLVKNGEIYAVIGQPLWEESFGAAELLDKAVRKEPIPWWTKLPAPFITKDKLGPYNALLDKVESAIHR